MQTTTTMNTGGMKRQLCKENQRNKKFKMKSGDLDERLERKKEQTVAGK